MSHPSLSRTVLRGLRQRSHTSLGPIERRSHGAERYFSLCNQPPRSRYHDVDVRKSLAAAEMLRKMEKDPALGKPAPTAEDIGAPPGGSSSMNGNYFPSAQFPSAKGGRPDYRNQRTLLADYVKPTIFFSLLFVAIVITIQGEFRKRERERRIRTPRADPGAEYEAEKAARLAEEASLKEDAASVAENGEEARGKGIVGVDKKERH